MKKIATITILASTLFMAACSTNNSQQDSINDVTLSTESNTFIQQTTEQPTTERSKEQKEKDAVWKKLYIEELSSFNNKEDYRFCLAYIDGDNIPELLMISDYEESNSYLFWFFNGALYHDAFKKDYFYYLERKNCFLIHNEYDYLTQTTKKENRIPKPDKVWNVTVEQDYIHVIDGKDVQTVGSGSTEFNDIDDEKIEKEKYVWNDNKLNNRSEYENERNKLLNPDNAKKPENLKSFSEICKDIRNF